MYFSPIETPIKVKEQVLPKLKYRKGLTVVEWGGSELSSIIFKIYTVSSFFKIIC